jgi:hypothetical protein
LGISLSFPAQATLVRYVDAATTPDNLAIVGVRAR